MSVLEGGVYPGAFVLNPGLAKLGKKEPGVLHVFTILGTVFCELDLFQMGAVNYDQEVNRYHQEVGSGEVGESDSDVGAGPSQVHRMTHPAVRSTQNRFSNAHKNAKRTPKIEDSPEGDDWSDNNAGHTDDDQRCAKKRWAEV